LKESKRRLERLEQNNCDKESERLEITLGGKAVVFRNANEAAKAWIAACVAVEETKSLPSISECITQRPACEVKGLSRF